MKKFFLLASIQILFSGLNAQNQFAQDFFKPIQLGVGETKICLTDFIPEGNVLANIHQSSGIQIKARIKDTLIVVSDGRSDAMATLDLIFKYKNKTEQLGSIPMMKSQKNLLKFTFPDKYKKFQKVQIKGTFNSWNQNELTLKYVDGKWLGETWAAEGIHQYVYVLNGEKEVRDPMNSDSISNGMGSFNSKLSIQSKNIELKTSAVTTTNTGSQKIYLETDLLNGEGIKQLKTLRVVLLMNNQKIEKSIVHKKLNSKSKKIESCMIEVDLPMIQDSVSFFRAWVYLANESYRSNDILIPILNGKVVLTAKQLSFKDPRTLIIYNPMIDRFKDGNALNNKPLNRADVNSKVDFWGGDVAGLTQKIEDGYFKKLNINTLWVSPVVKNPSGPWGEWKNPQTKFSGYHGYWPISSTETDSRFCTKNELENFIKTAEKNGINVLLDYVAHHIHQDHPLFKSHPDWYTSLYLPDGSKNTERWDDHRLTTWFDDFMPTFNFFKPEVVEAMTDSAVWWMKNYPIYGFRHDATKHIPDVFWRTLTKKLKTQVLIPQNRNMYQIGETYGSPELIGSYIGSGLLDAQFDFNLYDAAVSTFKNVNGNCKNLADIANDSKKNYGSHHTMGNITGNQDRPRFISLADGSLKDGENLKQVGWDRNIQVQDKLAYQRLQNLEAFMVSVPGVPVIYYGDEIGMPGANDPDCRRMMRFGGKNDTIAFLEQKHLSMVTKLLELRKSEICLQYGDCKINSISPTLLIVERNYFGSKLMFVFNTSSKVIDLKQIKEIGNNVQILLANGHELTNQIGAESFIVLKQN